jgi:hypothetical protein
MSANDTMSGSDPVETGRIDPVSLMIVNFPERVKRVERRVRIGDREIVEIVTLGDVEGDAEGEP